MRGMLDSTTPTDIPADYAGLVGGYVDGDYGPANPQGWTAAAWSRFPTQPKVRIAVADFVKGAHVYDCERGDFTPSQLAEVIHVARQAGDNPTGYFSSGQLAEVIAAFAAIFEPIPAYGWWGAWWPVGLGPADKTIPPGYVAHQYAGSAWMGHHYDGSVVLDYWPGVDAAPVLPAKPLPPEVPPVPKPILIWRIETPGELAPVTVASTLDDAIALANQSPPNGRVTVCTDVYPAAPE